MHEALRRRILRSLETLPEPKLYQVLDYIEFLESRYGEGTAEQASGLQKFAERLEDGLRNRTLSPSRLREAFQLISAADRAFSSVSEVGREILSDLQALADVEQQPGTHSGDREEGELPSQAGAVADLEGQSSRG